MKTEIVALIVWFTLVAQCLANCPSATDLSPCICESYLNAYRIKCMQNNTNDIKSIFAKISKDPEVLSTIYTELWIGSINIQELPENAIGDVQFEEITIYSQCQNLRRIHHKAFGSTRLVTTSLKILTTTVQDAPSPYSLIELFNSFDRLHRLESHSLIDVLKEGWDHTNLHGISDLTLKVNAIEGRPFANFKNLVALNLIQSNLNFISAHALEVGRRVDYELIPLFIELHENKLNSSSFEVGSLANIALNSGRRNVRLNLSGNKIVYLDENVFFPFLKEQHNSLILYNNTLLDCDDCKSSWICNQPEKLRMAIDSPTCKDGNLLDNCESSFKMCK